MTITDRDSVIGAHDPDALSCMNERPGDRMTTILALDLGTTTGWALRIVEGQTVSGTESSRFDHDKDCIVPTSLEGVEGCAMKQRDCQLDLVTGFGRAWASGHT